MTSKVKLFMGVDPGKTGAVGVIDSNMNLVTVIDCPTRKISKYSYEIEIVKFYELLKPFKNKIALCVMEKSGVMRSDGKTRVFSFGQTVGIFKSMLQLCEFEYIEVMPRVWKKYFRLSSDKQLSIDKAIRDIKGVDQYLTRKMDHHRAESLLLGAYAKILYDKGVVI